jgi:hypothetical protein
MPDLPAIIGSAATARALRPRSDLRQPGWTFWELRTINMHRVVGLLNEYRQFANARDLEGEIRGPSRATSKRRGGAAWRTGSWRRYPRSR